MRAEMTYGPRFILSCAARRALDSVEAMCIDMDICHGASYTGGSYPLWGNDGDTTGMERLKIAAYVGKVMERLDTLPRALPPQIASTGPKWLVVSCGYVLYATDSHRSAAIRAGKKSASVMSREAMVLAQRTTKAEKMVKIKESRELCHAVLVSLTDPESVTLL